MWHIYWLMEHKIWLMELAKCSDMLASPWGFKLHEIYIRNMIVFVLNASVYGVDKKTTLRWNLAFLSIYNLLESAFSKQIEVQIHTDSKGRNIIETRCLCISCKASLPLALVLSAGQSIKIKSIMQLTLAMINNHNKNLCTLNKQNDLCVMYKPILQFNGSTNTLESSLPKPKTLMLTVL